MNKPPSVWVFNDGRAGTFNQALGIAESLHIPFIIKGIKYNNFSKLPNLIRGATSIGIATSTIIDIENSIIAEGFPDFIITAGRRAAPFARHIRKRSKGHTQIIQIMAIGKSGKKDFALLIIPSHDKHIPKGKNVVKIIGAPHRVTRDKLRENATLWQDKFNHLPRPFTALIVGGSTKNCAFTNEMAEDLIAKVNKLLGNSERGTILVTTSRRTGKEQEEIILNQIEEPRYVYRWSDEGENPYFAFLSLADRIVVTGDSVSMCSESCASPVPVYIYDNDKLITKKHRRFLNHLFEEGYASSLKFELAEEEAPHMTLNPAEDIAVKIKELPNWRE